MRCFVAVELDDRLREPLARLLRERLPPTRDVRWCTREQLHVTLKFLGDVSDQQLRDVGDAVALAAAQIDPFTIRLDGLGCFPSERNPRVLWCGIEDPAGGCRRWMSNAEPFLTELGFEPEARAYHAHVTLGRSRNRAGADVIRRALQRLPAPEARQMLVRQIVVFESHLHPGGARYTPAFTAPLGQ